MIPGGIGEAVPIIAHGGEMVTPATGVIGGRGIGNMGITININGTINMDTEERVKELAQQIIRILGRQNELAKWGVGFNYG